MSSDMVRRVDPELTIDLTSDEYNKLLFITGAIVGAADDDDLINEFYPDFDANDREKLADAVDRFIRPVVTTGRPSRVEAGLSIVLRLAQAPHYTQNSYREALLPPFDYPEELNLWAMIADYIQRHRA